MSRAAVRMAPGHTRRKVVPPLGWPFSFRACTVTPADRHPLVKLNRYPGQVIGVGIRLPDEQELGGRVRHHALSLMWAKPARWWTRRA
jgi:hypothetical protein